MVNAQVLRPTDSYRRPGAGPLQVATESRKGEYERRRAEAKWCSDGVREAALLWRFVAEGAASEADVRGLSPKAVLL